MRARFAVSLLLLPMWAQALTFQPLLEDVRWEVEGDRFECRLTQPVTHFGYGEFVRRAGEKSTFRIRAQEAWLAKGSASLLAAAPAWRRDSDLHLGSMPVANNERTAESDQQQAGRLMSSLLEGRAPLIRHKTVQGERLEVRLLPVSFDAAYQDYLACTAGLSPVNYDQVRRSNVSFAEGGIGLAEQAKTHLEIILTYLKDDPSVNHIRLDGHSDSSGDRLTNRDVSRRRAIVVKNYLIAKGVDEQQIEVRFHGERYPLKPNNSATNRALNRRVTVQLDRVDDSYSPTAEQEKETLHYGDRVIE